MWYNEKGTGGKGSRVMGAAIAASKPEWLRYCDQDVLDAGAVCTVTKPNLEKVCARSEEGSLEMKRWRKKTDRSNAEGIDAGKRRADENKTSKEQNQRQTTTGAPEPVVVTAKAKVGELGRR